MFQLLAALTLLREQQHVVEVGFVSFEEWHAVSVNASPLALSTELIQLLDAWFYKLREAEAVVNCDSFGCVIDLATWMVTLSGEICGPPTRHGTATWECIEPIVFRLQV